LSNSSLGVFAMVNIAKGLGIYADSSKTSFDYFVRL